MLTPDVQALESWLAAHPPTSLLPMGDRLLLRSIQRDLTELPTLLAQAPAVLDAALTSGTARKDVASVLVVLACLADAGVDVAAFVPRVQQLLSDEERALKKKPEPARAVFRYWRFRAGLAPRFNPAYDVKDEPRDLPVLSAYYHLHRVFFATDYGRNVVERHVVGDAMVKSLEHARGLEENPDIVAEVLIAEAGLVPPDLETRRTYKLKLARLQGQDGGFALPKGEGADASHHAACVARLAVALVAR